MKKERPELSADTIHTIASLLIKIPNIEVVKTVCKNDLHLPEEMLEDAIKEARTVLTRAADYNREEEFGKAITALNELYSLSLKNREFKTAISVRKELTSMLSLKYIAETNAVKTSEGSEQLVEDMETIRQYLEPLGFGEPETPTVELTRLVVLNYVKLAARLQENNETE
jgi:hypothetical protein